MKLVELIIDDATGIEAISLVDEPAIEEYFVAFKKEQEHKFTTISDEKKILLGAALIPDKPIYRRNEDGEFYVYFSKSTVRKAAQQYMQQLRNNSHTLEHQEQIQGFSLVESWIVEDTEKDKSRLYAQNVPIGTWMVAIKCTNDEIWQEYVKTNKVRGFSIEGTFLDKAKVNSKMSSIKVSQSKEGDELKKEYEKWRKIQLNISVHISKAEKELSKSQYTKKFATSLYNDINRFLERADDFNKEIGFKYSEKVAELTEQGFSKIEGGFAKTEAEKSMLAWKKLSKTTTTELEKTRKKLLQFESPIGGWANTLDNAMYHIRQAQQFIDETTQDLQDGLRNESKSGGFNKHKALREIEDEIKKLNK